MAKHVFIVDLDLNGNKLLNVSQIASLTSIVFNSPIYNFIGVTPNTYAYFDASGNLISGAAPSGVTGSGTLNYVPKWTPSGTALGNSLIFDNGTNVGINTILPTAKLHVKGVGTGYNELIKLQDSAGNIPFYMYDNSEAYWNYGVVGGQTTKHTSGRWDFPNVVTIGGPTNTGFERFQVKGQTSDATAYTIQAVNLSNAVLLSVRNDGVVWVNSTDPGAQLSVYTSALPAFRDGVIGNAIASNGVGIKGYGAYGVSGYTATSAYGVGVYGNASSLPFTGYGGQFIGGFCAISGRSSTANANSQILSLIDSASIEKMVVLGNGNVGIATSIPSEKLHIIGSIRMVDGNQAAGKVLTSDANGVATWTTPAGGGVTGSGTLNYITKWTPSGTALGDSLIFDNGTNVGIGTAVPTAKFHVVIAGVNPAIKLSNATYDVNICPSGTGTLSELNTNNIGWELKSTDGYFRLNRLAGAGPVLIYTNGTATGLALSGAVAGTEHIRITTTGNVGIATSAPTRLLDSRGTFNFEPVAATTYLRYDSFMFEMVKNVNNLLKINRDNAGISELFGSGEATLKNTSSNAKYTITTSYSQVIEDANIFFSRSDGYRVGTWDTVNFRLAVGALSITPPTPATTLHVYGDEGIRVQSPSGGYGYMTIKPYASGQLYTLISDSDSTELRMGGAFGANAGKWRLYNSNPLTPPSFHINKANPTLGVAFEVVGHGNTIATYAVQISNNLSTSLLAITDNGNVGINVINPLYKLQIVGNTTNTGGTITRTTPSSGAAAMWYTDEGILNLISDVTEQQLILGCSPAGSYAGINLLGQTIMQIKFSTILGGELGRVYHTATDFNIRNTGILNFRRNSNNFIYATTDNTNGNWWLGAPTGGSPTVATHRLHVEGSVRIVDGTQANGYIFTSDANGVGSWQAPAIAAVGNQVVVSIAATTNDQTTTGTSYIRMEATGGNQDVTGFANGYAGKRLIITCFGANQVRLKHLDAGSAAGNRINCGATGIQNNLSPNDTLEMVYDGVALQWNIINHNV